jgi:hypothetical protein
MSNIQHSVLSFVYVSNKRVPTNNILKLCTSFILSFSETSRHFETLKTRINNQRCKSVLSEGYACTRKPLIKYLKY